MPTTTISTLNANQIDDLLFLARLGETADLKADVGILATSLFTTPGTILLAAVDKNSGNGLLHMAAANGHTDTLKELLSLSVSNQALSLNLQNSSGNTPLHWAALNGHLPAVKLLIEAGADPTVMNKAGKDAVYEAEANEKNELAAWLLTEGKGLESAVGGSENQAAVGAREETDVEGQLEEVMKEGTPEAQP
ncbi:MAG: hypothetical protein ASARMPREDX12_005649 [Alectoria sarmentosa]|nr:MAG: hypothetical protein ASARMPRED_003900 [Alectoria sarmentosa]CAD6592084.1 MAG: hypothetical protein ASARMPREDX12_005649 [Alectoria sarmentosa]